MAATIYVDMDGVLADFSKKVFELWGVKFHPGLPLSDSIWNKISNEKHFYRDLDLTPEATRLWNFLSLYPNKKVILTALPRKQTYPDADADKLAWVRRYSSVFGQVEFYAASSSRNKWKYAKRGDILIDDREDNIKDWVNFGDGIGIHHFDIKTTMTITKFVMGH